MRTRDLEAGGYYAVKSCSYLAVVKAADDGTVRADWQPTDQGTYGAGDGSQREVLDVRSRYSSYRPARAREGVLVDLYAFDAAGRRFGDPVARTIVYPKDFQLPWGFCVNENRGRIRQLAESFATDRADRRERRRLNAAAQAFHPDASVNRSRGPYGKDSISITFESRAALERFLEANAGAHT